MYIVDAADEVRRRLSMAAEVPLTLVVSCESGAVAAAIACAALATAGIHEPAEAAARVGRACEGRGIACKQSEMLAVAELADSLSNGGKRRAKKAGKAASQGPAAKAAAGPAPGSAPAADAAPASAPVASEEDSSEDDGGPIGEVAREREREQRRITYERAVKHFGAPGSTPLHVVGAPQLGGGWTAVAARPAAKPKPPSGVWGSNAPREGGAYSADGLTEKQRKNRRKAEKGKEMAHQREEEQKARLIASGRTRGAR